MMVSMALAGTGWHWLGGFGSGLAEEGATDISRHNRSTISTPLQPSSLAPMQQDRPRKLQRISQACDLCHRRSIRCRPSNEDQERCQNCYDFDVACTYERPSKRRKHPQAPAAPSQPSTRSSQSRTTLPSDLVPVPELQANSTSTRNDSMGKANEFGPLPPLVASADPGELELSWKAFALSSETTIFELFDVYMEVVYPLYPFFHEATERAKLRNRDHLTDKGFFASIMAMCALSSARIRDGAIPSRMPEAVRNPEASSEIFFAAAKSVFSADLDKLRGADYIRACTLLSLTSIQYGQSLDVQQYQGLAMTLIAMQRFYDEKYWPSGLDDSQKETYRRWNFTIDLYRVLEHVVNKARAKRFNHDDRRSVDSLVFGDAFSEKSVMATMLNMYYALPPQFKSTPPMTGDPAQDIYAFQAANIQATLQLLRMMLFSTEDGPSVERKCDVANEVLSVFQTIPTRYLRAISTPLIYQLGSIGGVLGSVFEQPLQQKMYERVRSSLVLMAELLETLESNLHRSAGASQGLLAQVEKIDQYMRSPRNVTHPQPVPQQTVVEPLQLPIENHMATPAIQPVSGMNGGVVQLPTDLNLEWPWPLYQEGPYYTENNNGY
ncbi:hypothetical protein D6D15_08594 [Aureobasidium pullulans]|uniref:Zn(2)-C6 fungal-type domain-containing protein n=1 Tax=Aureobasidium pullulans TaxID=5580 RepID=A0A4V4IUA6_AURPU|nr:hypothetical protein D6D15_08594 [Aureobasidium pullulans]